MRNRNLIGRVLAVALAIVAILVGQVDMVFAWDWDTSSTTVRRSYFRAHVFESGNSQVISGGITGSSLALTWNSTYGCPNGCATKSDFITFMDWKLNSTPGRTLVAAQDKVGSNFIVSAMLNLPRNGSGGHDMPTSTQVTQWKSMINQSNVWMGIESRPFTLHTGNRNFSDGSGWDIQWWRAVSTTERMLVFREGGPTGAIFAQIELKCANIADYPTAPPPGSTWDASGSAYVNGAANVSAYPGEHVKFTYKLNNIGTGNAPSIWWSTSGGSSGNALNLAAGSSTALPGGVPGYEDYVVPNTPGATYCRHMSFQNSQNNAATEDSNNACVTVKSNFDVFPKVTNGADDVTAITPGDSTTMSGFTVNTGNAADRAASYEIEQFVVPQGVAKPAFGGVFNQVNGGVRYAGASHVDRASCTGWLTTTYGSGTIKNCTELSYVSSYTYGAGTVPLPALAAINADDYNPGDWVCQFISVSDYRYIVTEGYANPHRVSYPICVVIAKRPSIQIWGDDLSVGNNFAEKTPAPGSLPLLNNNASVKTSRFRATNAVGAQATFGSWAEYGIFAPAPNGLIASATGGALSGKYGNPTDFSADATPANKLTFANTDPSNYGKWTQARTIGSIEQFATSRYAESSDNNPNISLNTIGISDGEIKIIRLTHAGAITVSGAYGKTATAILITDQDVTITDDITITNRTINKLGSAPQVIIIAKNIIINDNVKNIDAWLMARPTDPTEGLDGPNGKISTCNSIQPNGQYATGLTINTCNNPLQINGAVMAREVQFRRTYGADRNPPLGLSAPAEVINLRADAYMWARESASSSDSLPIKTMSVTELPPRF